MAKSFRKFREDSYDDEWGEDDFQERKRNKLRDRKQKQRQKNRDKMASYDVKIDDE